MMIKLIVLCADVCGPGCVGSGAKVPENICHEEFRWPTHGAPEPRGESRSKSLDEQLPPVNILIIKILAAADLRRGAPLTRNSERDDAPRITRAIQDRIGRELRDMYAELLRQPLPDNLIAPLRASAEPSPRDVLEGAVAVLRSESPASSDATLTASLPKAKSA